MHCVVLLAVVSVRLDVSPKAVDMSVGASLTVATGFELPATVACVFADALESPCIVATDNVSRCTCQAPRSQLLAGDTVVSLVAGDAHLGQRADGNANTTGIGNATITYYQANAAPELLSFRPSGAACASGLGGGPILTLSARNLAPTGQLLCDFGVSIGRSAGSFISASRERQNESVGEAQCAVPQTPLLGDTVIRLSHDDGARWSQPSAIPFACHDSTSPPVLISAEPRSVDLATVSEVSCGRRAL